MITDIIVDTAGDIVATFLENTAIWYLTYVEYMDKIHNKDEAKDNTIVVSKSGDSVFKVWFAFPENQNTDVYNVFINGVNRIYFDVSKFTSEVDYEKHSMYKKTTNIDHNNFRDEIGVTFEFNKDCEFIKGMAFSYSDKAMLNIINYTNLTKVYRSDYLLGMTLQNNTHYNKSGLPFVFGPDVPEKFDTSRFIKDLIECFKTEYDYIKFATIVYSCSMYNQRYDAVYKDLKASSDVVKQNAYKIYSDYITKSRIEQPTWVS